MARGMILSESLVNRSAIEGSDLRIEERYAMLMDGVTPVEVVMVSVPERNLLLVLETISKALLPKRYYAHFVHGEVMYVVFPSTISVVSKGSQADGRTCLEIGRHFDVPASQLPIDKMFAFGHAEHD